MSCAVEALVERQMQLVAAKTYGQLQRLHDEYQRALVDFKERCEAEQRERAAFAARQDAAVRSAVRLAGVTHALAAEDATVTFLCERVEELQQRVAALPAAEHALAEPCRALLQAIADTPENLPVHFDHYQRLSEALAALLARQGNVDVLHESLAEELRVLHAEIEAPLLATEAHAALRRDLLAQLTALEKLGVRQIAVAGQALSLLRQRVRRELKQAAERELQRARDAAAIRELTGDCMAKLQAIARQEHLEEESAQSHQLLERLQQLLVASPADELIALRQCAREATDLFTACAKRLEEADTAAYLGDQVTDILLSMGYQVTQLPESTAHAQQFVAGVDDEIGVQFRVDGRGRLGTKMVALHEDSAHAGRNAQEKICTLVDEVFAALRRRQCRVRERFRSSLVVGESLPIVRLPEQEVSALREKVQPKQMGSDEQ